MLESTFRLTRSATDLADPEGPDLSTDIPVVPQQVTLTLGTTGAETVGPPSAGTLDSTETLASNVRDSVKTVVEAKLGDAPMDAATADQVMTLAEQVASILVLSDALLRAGLDASGDNPDNLVANASTDLARLLGAQRLVDRLSVAGASTQVCAVAAARIDGALGRLEALAQVLASKIDDVRVSIDQLGIESDLDQFESSILAFLDRIRAFREAGAVSAPMPGSVETARLVDAVKSESRALQEQLTESVKVLDAAAKSGARGETGGGLPAPSNAATVLGTSFGSLPATTPGEDAPPSEEEVQQWLADIAFEFGGLDIAAGEYGLDSAARLVFAVHTIADLTFDPLAEEGQAYGVSLNALFGREDNVWDTVSWAVWRQTGNSRFESYSLSILDEVLARQREAAKQERDPSTAVVPTVRPRVLVNEVVILKTTDAPAETVGRQPRVTQPPATVPQKKERPVLSLEPGQVPLSS
jgi:hypothetical protein